jgi:hypothetical protein
MRLVYAPVGLLLASCSWWDTPLENRQSSFDSTPQLAGSYVAFFESSAGRILPFDTDAKKAAAPISVKGAIKSAQSIEPSVLPPSSASRAPVLALLTAPTARTRSLVALEKGPAFTPSSAVLSRAYDRLLVSGSIAVALPPVPAGTVSRTSDGGADMGSASSGDGGAGEGDSDSIERFAVADVTHVEDKLEIAFADADRLVEMTVSPPNHGPTWVALASATEVVLVQALPEGASDSHAGLNANYEVDLTGRQAGATAPPKLTFDANGSRLFIWAPGSAEVLWVDLASADIPLPELLPQTLPLSRMQFDGTPSDMTLARTGVNEVLVGVMPNDSGGASIGVLDPSANSSNTTATSVPADSIVISRATTKTDDPTPDTLVFFAKDLLNRATDTIGVANAATLATGNAAASTSPDDATAAPLVTLVPLRSAYRRITQVAPTNLLLENKDGSADVYQVGDSTITNLKGWSTLVGAGPAPGGRIISKTASGAGSYVIRSFEATGSAFQDFSVPADITSFFAISASSYVFVHRSALGLLTSYAPGRDGPSGYTAVGFLAAELTR